jgi:hypothetical protein
MITDVFRVGKKYEEFKWANLILASLQLLQQ